MSCQYQSMALQFLFHLLIWLAQYHLRFAFAVDISTSPPKTTSPKTSDDSGTLEGVADPNKTYDLDEDVDVHLIVAAVIAGVSVLMCLAFYFFLRLMHPAEEEGETIIQAECEASGGTRFGNDRGSTSTDSAAPIGGQKGGGKKTRTVHEDTSSPESKPMKGTPSGSGLELREVTT